MNAEGAMANLRPGNLDGAYVAILRGLLVTGISQMTRLKV